ncbi:MAG: geranyl transferase [Candidatus Hydrogenedens sp.]|nr:geranyl transferase [Candidatus Hydrogenedens sp.]
MDARALLRDKAARTEAAMRAYADAWNAPEPLGDAVRYSLFAGGKRLRPALALGACEIVCGDDAPAMPAACALEMIHTYSLIHDDLPAMDDDALRRGQPTCHVKFGEATAILAGDALLTMAFDALADTGSMEAVREVARAAGIAGMVGGQQMDLSAEGKALGIDGLQAIHRAKTGALIRCAVRVGAMLGGATPEALAALTAYGEHIGLAFQIADDVLDVAGDEAAIGKPVGSDAKSDKSTYPALLGLDRSRELAQETVDAALEALSAFGPEADAFRALARYIVEREH